MSYARMWTGAVDWKLDNMGVVRGWRKLRHMAPNAWTKVGDRDVYGYLGLLRAAVEGKWRVAHVKGHAERRKKRWEWSLDELSNDAVDKMAGRVRRAVTPAEVGRHTSPRRQDASNEGCAPTQRQQLARVAARISCPSNGASHAPGKLLDRDALK